MLVTVVRLIGRVCVLVLTLCLFSGAVAPAAMIRVDWTDSPSGDVVRYELHYGLDGGGFPSVVPKDIDPGVESYTLSGLTVGTIYHFKLYAFDSAGNRSIRSNIDVCEALPWSFNAPMPVAPSTVWLGKPDFEISWNVEDVGGAEGVRLELSLVNQFFDGTLECTEWDPDHCFYSDEFNSPNDSISMSALELQELGVYQIRVVALDEYGTTICCFSDSVSLEVISGPPPLVDPDTSTVTAYPGAIPADGVSVSLITVTPRTATGDLVGPNLSVVLQTTAGTLLGVVQDNFNGTYTQSLRSSLEVTQAQVRATADGVLITQQAVVSFFDPSEMLDMIITGPGPGPENQPLVRVYVALVDQPALMQEFPAYGAGGYGVNVCTGDITGDGSMEIITGPGPGEVYGPHIRGFNYSGNPVPGVNFLAYGTNKFGVNVASGDIDGDGYDEIVSGAGPGAVFGPHVRGWDVDGVDGSTCAAMPGVNFMAYGTNKFGVNVASGDIDGDGYDEIVSGAGPGAVFGPHVRGWDVDGSTCAAMPGVSFLAYGTPMWGVNVACGDIDGDGYDEIVSGAGPGAVFGPHVRGWDVDGGAVAAMPGVNFFAYGTNKYGVNVTCGDIDGDGIDEIITGPGPGVMFNAHVRGFDYEGSVIQGIPDVNFMAYDEDVKFGARLAVGRGFY